MVSSELEKIDNAAVARSEEIHKLSSFFSLYQQPRAFCKELPRESRQPTPKDEMESSALDRRPPFHHLRDELALLLGVSGSNLVITTWEHHALERDEIDPGRLRPVLLKLFSTAARIAAPRGSSLGLKAVVRAFESDYFPVSPVGKGQASSQPDQRFNLLALIQNGRGVTLLEGFRPGHLRALSGPEAARNAWAVGVAEAASLTAQDEAERLRMRREFLFESCCRAKSWTEAYRHSRILSYGAPRARISPSVERRLPEVYRMNLGAKTPNSKKKQLLADIARLPAEYDEQPEEFALRAVASLAISCRPGEEDALVCRLLPASDPRWRLSLRRLYRHRPQPESWMLTLRKLWQQEPSLRPYCRLLFSLIRFSRRRAEVAHAAQPPVDSRERLVGGLLGSRLARAREEVAAWNVILPASTLLTRESGSPPGGTVVKVRRTLWEHILKVSHELGLNPPHQVRVVPRFEDVGVRETHGEIELVISPVMLSTREGEARFLVARALFRHAVGLDRLEGRGAPLADHQAIAERALAYAEWKSYSLEPFSVWQDEDKVEPEELQVALEEMFWQTGDQVYARLCEVLANRCWCPRAELEADVYAHRFCDMTEATYGVIATGLGCLTRYRGCESNGIASLIPRMAEHPALVLRLQNLWMSGCDEVQKNLTR